MGLGLVQEDGEPLAGALSPQDPVGLGLGLGLGLGSALGLEIRALSGFGTVLRAQGVARGLRVSGWGWVQGLGLGAGLGYGVGVT